MDDKHNILKQAEQYVNVGAAKIALEQMKDYVPVIVGMNKSVFEEMKKQGFNDEQAFKFSSQYTLKAIFDNNQK